jgi:putative hydrolases of HD superfamily
MTSILYLNFAKNALLICKIRFLLWPDRLWAILCGMNHASSTSQTPPTIGRILELQKLLVSFAGVDRKVFLPPAAEVPETDVEHSFSLAILCWFLAPHFPQLDAGRLLQLCLAHDIVEAYSGDTFSFDAAAVANQHQLEAEALVKLKQEWSDFPALTEAIDEYEARRTPEAHFVVALDRFQPVMMDYLSEGRTWHKLGITFDKLMAVKDKDLASSEVAEYYTQLKEILVANPHLFPTAQ